MRRRGDRDDALPALSLTDVIENRDLLTRLHDATEAAEIWQGGVHTTLAVATVLRPARKCDVKTAALYAPPTSCSVPRRRRLSAASRPTIADTCLSSAALSSSVRNSLSAYRAGRCNGSSESLVQMPCRSGSPHGVVGAGPGVVVVPAVARS